MNLLLIKMSSLGDVFHTFPALTEAKQQIPDLAVSWVVEEDFAAMASWHPAVDKVIPIAWRRWRGNLMSRDNRSELRQFLQALKADRYDLVLDAQGLIKSGIVARLARCDMRVGYDRHSARESLASRAYSRCIPVAKGTHAIWRVRQLFAEAIGYSPGPRDRFSYGLDKSRWLRPSVEGEYLVFLHGTTWVTKLWPEAHWVALAGLAARQGYRVLLPWADEREQARAERIAGQAENAELLPRMGLSDLTAYLCHASGVVGVDTGLSHVVAGLEVPSVAIYGATDATLTGVLGPTVTAVSAEFACSPCLSKQCRYDDRHPPCYDTVGPELVWRELSGKLAQEPHRPGAT